MHPITHAELEGLKQKEEKISETTIDGLVSYALKFMTSLNEKSLRPSPLGF
jgi:hypothetical protein